MYIKNRHEEDNYPNNQPACTLDMYSISILFFFCCGFLFLVVCIVYVFQHFLSSIHNTMIDDLQLKSFVFKEKSTSLLIYYSFLLWKHDCIVQWHAIMCQIGLKCCSSCTLPTEVNKSHTLLDTFFIILMLLSGGTQHCTDLLWIFLLGFHYYLLFKGRQIGALELWDQTEHITQHDKSGFNFHLASHQGPSCVWIDCCIYEWLAKEWKPWLASGLL